MQQKFKDLGRRLLNEDLDVPIIQSLAREVQDDEKFKEELYQIVLSSRSITARDGAEKKIECANAMTILVCIWFQFFRIGSSRISNSRCKSEWWMV